MGPRAATLALAIALALASCSENDGPSPAPSPSPTPLPPTATSPAPTASETDPVRRVAPLCRPSQLSAVAVGPGGAGLGTYYLPIGVVNLDRRCRLASSSLTVATLAPPRRDLADLDLGDHRTHRVVLSPNDFVRLRLAAPNMRCGPVGHVGANPVRLVLTSRHFPGRTPVVGYGAPAGFASCERVLLGADRRTPPRSDSSPPCDPGFGLPKAAAGCPDPEPLTAWLDVDRAGRLELYPFRTLGNDPEGRAYARKHHLEFPFSNDYYDAPAGPPQAFGLAPGTACTGAILAGLGGPLADHPVDCAALAAATGRTRVPVAVWRVGHHVVQVSELYRP